jgi:hypothetical protein
MTLRAAGGHAAGFSSNVSALSKPLTCCVLLAAFLLLTLAWFSATGLCPARALESPAVPQALIADATVMPRLAAGQLLGVQLQLDVRLADQPPSGLAQVSNRLWLVASSHQPRV